jgi:tetratricopeptide repeat protein
MNLGDSGCLAWALSYRDADRASDAIELFERVVAGSEQVLGPEHPSTLDARMNLASSYASAGIPPTPSLIWNR